jgi:hypothetical protein
VHNRQDARAAASVRRVLARVDLQSTALAELDTRAAGNSDKLRVQLLPDSPESLSLHVSLSAVDSEGRRIASAGSDFGMSGPRRGVWHCWHGPPLPGDREEAERLVFVEHRVDASDIEDGINQMLGRDPTLHRPPRLSWDKLIRALDEAGVAVSERGLDRSAADDRARA